MNNKRLEELLKDIYDAYEGQLTDATDMWLSEYCTSTEEEINALHNKEELLSYFKSLLTEVRDLFEGH